jgi:hypothetical protein
MPKTSERQPFLLDTLVWLWLVLASEALGSSARRTISRAASVGNLRIAAMTVWEVVCWSRAAASFWASQSLHGSKRLFAASLL